MSERPRDLFAGQLIPHANFMEIKRVLDYKQLKIQSNGKREFLSLGTLGSDAPALLTFCTSPSYLLVAQAKKNVVAVFVREADTRDLEPNTAWIFAEEPDIEFFLYHKFLFDHTAFYNRDGDQHFDSQCRISRKAHMAEKDVIIGCGTVIEPGVVIMEGTVIGPNVYVGPGTVIGVEGTQTIEHDGRKFFRVPHAGGVRVGANTFIGANTVIVRGVFREPTCIGDDVTLGNLVNIGHNCMIGDDVVILPGSIICGSVTVKSGTRVSPGAVIRNGKVIGKNAWVGLGAVVTKDVEDNGHVSGNFAIEHGKMIRHVKELAG